MFRFSSSAFLAPLKPFVLLGGDGLGVDEQVGKGTGNRRRGACGPVIMMVNDFLNFLRKGKLVRAGFPGGKP